MQNAGHASGSKTAKVPRPQRWLEQVSCFDFVTGFVCNCFDWVAESKTRFLTRKIAHEIAQVGMNK